MNFEWKSYSCLLPCCCCQPSRVVLSVAVPRHRTTLPLLNCGSETGTCDCSTVDLLLPVSITIAFESRICHRVTGIDLTSRTDSDRDQSAEKCAESRVNKISDPPWKYMHGPLCFESVLPGFIFSQRLIGLEESEGPIRPRELRVAASCTTCAGGEHNRNKHQA